MKRSTFLTVLLLAASCLLCAAQARANSTCYGSSITSYDPNTDTITATGITDPDYLAEDYYEARVVSSLRDSDGNLFASGAETDTWDAGYASVTLEYTGTTPGMQYTLRSLHGFLMDVADPSYGCYCYFDDYYNYGFYGNQGIDTENGYNFLGNGPLVVRHTSSMTLGYTFASTAVPPKVDILLNGNVVTDQTVNVIVGQQINLSLRVLPQTSSATNIQWTVPGNPIGGYLVNFTDPTSATSASVTPIGNLQADQLSFYWVGGADGRQVTVTSKVNDTPFTKTTTFNVKRPTAQITATTGTVALDTASLGDFTLHFGVPSNIGTPGIAYSRTITIPSGFTGITEYVQVVTSSTRSMQPNTGSQVTLQGYGLDTVYPYSTNASDEDSPRQGVSACDDLSVTTSDHFTLWLMFKPIDTPGTAIYVPLRQLNWSWSGAGTRISGCAWVLSTSSKSVGSDNDTTDFPTWTTNITQFGFQ